MLLTLPSTTLTPLKEDMHCPPQLLGASKRKKLVQLLNNFVILDAILDFH